MIPFLDLILAIKISDLKRVFNGKSIFRFFFANFVRELSDIFLIMRIICLGGIQKSCQIVARLFFRIWHDLFRTGHDYFRIWHDYFRK